VTWRAKDRPDVVERDGSPARGWATYLGHDWRIRWWHHWTRASVAGYVATFIGISNTADQLGHGRIGGLEWLLAILAGVALIGYSGLEQVPHPYSGSLNLKPGDLAGSPEPGEPEYATGDVSVCLQTER
jgi:hypothetical protein